MKRVRVLVGLCGLMTVILIGAPSAAVADGGPYSFGTTYQILTANGTYEKFRLVDLGNCFDLTTNALEHQWQTSGGWSSWYSLGQCSSEFDIGMNFDLREEAFVLASDVRVYHDWQKNPGAGPWSGWYVLGASNDLWQTGPKVYSYTQPNLQPYMHVYAWRNNARFVNYQTQHSCCWSGWNPG